MSGPSSIVCAARYFASHVHGRPIEHCRRRSSAERDAHGHARPLTAAAHARRTAHDSCRAMRTSTVRVNLLCSLDTWKLSTTQHATHLHCTRKAVHAAARAERDTLTPRKRHRVHALCMPCASRRLAHARCPAWTTLGRGEASIILEYQKKRVL